MHDLLSRADLAPAATQFAKACAASRAHSEYGAKMLSLYGDHGPQVSGVIRDHFPKEAKEHLRLLCFLVTEYSNAAWDARPKRVHSSTMRKLSRAVAARDGSGFYGPQA